MPLSLTDDELQIILTSAAPIPIADRAGFLEAVATRLQQTGGELGVGLVSRICAELQRQHFHPPSLNHAARWDR